MWPTIRFPNTTFIVGYDTAARILHPRYYQHSQENLLMALATIQAQGCQFLVAGRVNNQGQFHDLTNLKVPSPFKQLFQEIPASLFRHDISSTELRSKEQAANH